MSANILVAGCMSASVLSTHATKLDKQATVLGVFNPSGLIGFTMEFCNNLALARLANNFRNNNFISLASTILTKNVPLSQIWCGIFNTLGITNSTQNIATDGDNAPLHTQLKRVVSFDSSSLPMNLRGDSVLINITSQYTSLYNNENPASVFKFLKLVFGLSTRDAIDGSEFDQKELKGPDSFFHLIGRKFNIDFFSEPSDGVFLDKYSRFLQSYRAWTLHHGYVYAANLTISAILNHVTKPNNRSLFDLGVSASSGSMVACYKHSDPQGASVLLQLWKISVDIKKCSSTVKNFIEESLTLLKTNFWNISMSSAAFRDAVSIGFTGVSVVNNFFNKPGDTDYYNVTWIVPSIEGIENKKQESGTEKEVGSNNQDLTAGATQESSKAGSSVSITANPIRHRKTINAGTSFFCGKKFSISKRSDARNLRLKSALLGEVPYLVELTDKDTCINNLPNPGVLYGRNTGKLITEADLETFNHYFNNQSALQERLVGLRKLKVNPRMANYLKPEAILGNRETSIYDITVKIANCNYDSIKMNDDYIRTGEKEIMAKENIIKFENNTIASTLHTDKHCWDMSTIKTDMDEGRYALFTDCCFQTIFVNSECSEHAMCYMYGIRQGVIKVGALEINRVPEQNKFARTGSLEVYVLQIDYDESCEKDTLIAKIRIIHNGLALCKRVNSNVYKTKESRYEEYRRRSWIRHVFQNN